MNASTNMIDEFSRVIRAACKGPNTEDKDTNTNSGITGQQRQSLFFLFATSLGFTLIGAGEQMDVQ
jgi:hypothetical protein